MELLKDKLFNGISFEILNDGNIKSKSFYSIMIRVTNHNDKKKKVQLKARYISTEEGLLDTYGGIDMLGNWGIIFFLIAILSAFAAAAITLVFDVITFNDSRRKEDDSEKF